MSSLREKRHVDTCTMYQLWEGEAHTLKLQDVDEEMDMRLPLRGLLMSFCMLLLRVQYEKAHPQTNNSFKIVANTPQIKIAK